MEENGTIKTIESYGIIVFDPKHATRKHKKQGEWKSHALVQLNCDVHLYYSWFLRRRHSVILNKPLRKAHVTFISDKTTNKAAFDKVKKKYNGKNLSLQHEIIPKTNGEHWWLKVYCEQAKDIREEAGLNRDPYWGLHLTLGYANEKNIGHSKYIYNLYKKGLLGY